MPTSDYINRAAALAAGIEHDDVQQLVSLRDALAEALDDSESGAEVRDAMDTLERVVLRDCDDPQAELARVTDLVHGLARLLDQGAANPETPAANGVDQCPAGSPSEAAPRAQPEPTGAPDLDPELLEAWTSSTRESLDSIETAALSLEAGEDGPGVDEVRRLLHNVKGECGVVGAHDAQTMFHEAESAIDRVGAAGGAFPSAALLELVDWMRRAIDAYASGSKPAGDAALLSRLTTIGDTAAQTPVPSTPGPDASGGGDGEYVHLVSEGDETVREFIVESREHLAAAEQALLELESTTGDTELVSTVFRAFHTIKGVAGFLNLTPIVDLAHRAEFLLDAVRNGNTAAGTGVLDAALLATDVLGALITNLDGGEPVGTQAYRDVMTQLDAALRGEPAPESPTPRPLPASPAAQAAADSPSPGATTRRFDQAIKVSTTRLDSLVDMVGELVIGHQMVVQDPAVRSIAEQRALRNIGHVGKIIRDLQEVAMSLRMVTLRGTFQKMARLVRDLSVKSGKAIRLDIHGEDTELDRTVVDEIGDPLVHMIRNACDHGLETPEERRAAGKPAEGRLALRAFHKGGAIVIEVQDDGRGLSREKLITKALERGVIPPERDPKEMSDSEVFQLIFAPGFSTAEKVTDVSGRGVGMDVVRRNIEALRGTVEIRSEYGKGSTFVLSLPLTMAIIDGMVVRVGAQRYVIPTLSIEQSFRPDSSRVVTVAGRGRCALVRGAILAIHSLRDLFDIPSDDRAFEDTLLVVLESNAGRCCLQVDEIVGQQQVVIKSLGAGVPRSRAVFGGAILGDGRVAPILDVAGMITEATECAADPLVLTAGDHG